MPIARIQLPDGRIGRFEVPDGTTPEQAQSMALESFHSQGAPSSAPSTPAPTPTPPSNTDVAINAGNKLVAGIPDALLNTPNKVMNLVKAGVGTAATALGRPDMAPELTPDPDYASKALRGMGFIREEAEPQTGGQRLLDAGVQGGLGMLVNPANSWKQILAAALTGGASGIAGQATKEATGNDALAIAASLAPKGISHYGAEAAKRVVRGGEAGRQEMQDRIEVLKRAGVDKPTLGLASGNETIGGLENLLQSTPGAVGVMGNARTRVIEGLRGKSAQAADLAAPESQRGAWQAGRAIQSGIDDFKGNFQSKQGDLYGALDELMPKGTRIPVSGTAGALSSLSNVDPSAPNVGKMFVNGKISGIRDAFDLDTGQVLPTKMQSATVNYGQPAIPAQLSGEGVVRSQPAQSGSVKRLVNALANSPGEGVRRIPDPELPYSTVAKLRSQVGSELSNGSLVPEVPLGQWKALYKGLSQDMEGAAAKNGPQSEAAWNRANDFTRSGMARLEKLAPFADKNAPEQAFTSLMQTTKENASVLQAIKKSLPEGARGAVAGTVIDRLGRSTPGQQNDLGDKWSPERFLTNWNSMSPKARDEMFSGFQNAAEVKDAVSAVAKSTSMMRDSSKLWANPSGTGANLAARATLAAPLVPALAGSLPAATLTALGVAGGAGGANLLARGLTSNWATNAAARKTTLSPRDIQQLSNILITDSRLADQLKDQK